MEELVYQRTVNFISPEGVPTDAHTLAKYFPEKYREQISEQAIDVLLGIVPDGQRIENYISKEYVSYDALDWKGNLKAVDEFLKKREQARLQEEEKEDVQLSFFD